MRELRTANPAWDRDTDIRISGFSKLSNAHGAASLGIKFYANQLLDPGWWQQYGSSFSTEDKKRSNRAFVDLLKVGYIQVAFSSLESTIREILRAVDSSACNGSTAAFKNVYECLIRTKLNGMDFNTLTLLDLLRTIRNTVHNNGVYFSKRQTDEAIVYDRQTFDFTHGDKINFVTWDLMTDLYDAARSSLRQIVSRPEVAELPGTIIDPYA